MTSSLSALEAGLGFNGSVCVGPSTVCLCKRVRFSLQRLCPSLAPLYPGTLEFILHVLNLCSNSLLPGGGNAVDTTSFIDTLMVLKMCLLIFLCFCTLIAAGHSLDGREVQVGFQEVKGLT